MPQSSRISTARIFFEEIKNHPDPFTFLSGIPFPPRTEPFFEEEWIDFKGKPQDDNDAKRIWSKALSGYANITDGLIIWGIDARKTAPRDIDAACGLRLIPNPKMLEAKLREWIRDATNSPVIGVEYLSYTNTAGEGFVVCLIPESIYKPHRAEFADKQYYYRAGNNFLPAEPGLLRTLFHRQINPYLWMEVKLQYQIHPVDIDEKFLENPSNHIFNKILNDKSSMYYEVILHNTGSATAKDAYIIVDASHKLNFHPGNDWALSASPRYQAALRAIRPIHPNEISNLFSASFQDMFPNRTKEQNSWEIFPGFEKVHIQFVCYADNFQQQEVFVEFSANDLSFKTKSAQKQGFPEN